MSGIVVSITERRLARDGVKITFFKALVKLNKIESFYPGGLSGFIEKYKSITPKQNLVGVTFPNMSEMNQFVDDMSIYGIVRGRDIATANQVHGEMQSCEGIRFITLERLSEDTGKLAFPVWYACSERSVGDSATKP